MKIETPLETKLRVLGHPLNNTNVVIRYIIYIFVVMLLMFMVVLPSENIKNEVIFWQILWLTALFSPIFLVIWFERHILKFRKEYGLPLYKGVWKETDDIAERLEKEQNTVVVQSNEVDKNDIGYWFSLFEKGAITKDEYEAKKAELLGNSKQ